MSQEYAPEASAAPARSRGSGGPAIVRVTSTASTSAPADRSPAASASFLLTRGSRMRRPASGPRRADPAELVTSPGTPWGAPASLTADLFSSEGRRAGR